MEISNAKPLASNYRNRDKIKTNKFIAKKKKTKYVITKTGEKQYKLF